MDTSLLNSKSWKWEAFEPQPVPETLWPILSKLDLKPLTNWQGVDISEVQEVRKPLMEGCLLAFCTDKIEKLTIGFHILKKRMALTSLSIAPNDDYDFPTFATEFVEHPDSLHFLVDMHPLRDLVIDSWYRERYLDPVEPIWKEYQDVQMERNIHAWYRAFLSPFSIGGRHKVEGSDRSGLSRVADCLAKYVEYYVDHVIPNAEPVKDPQAKEFAIKRKRAIRETYRTREYRDVRTEPDSDGGPVVKTLGVDLAKKQLHALF